MAQVEALAIEGYQGIVQVNVPTRFYWNSDGTFDGIDFGPCEEMQEWEDEMLADCLVAIRDLGRA